MSSAAVADTAVQERTLLELEAVIDAGLQTFVEVGSALAEIRERRLYRDQYDSFEVYCRSRFNFNRQRASQLIKAAEVSRILDSPPSRASHAESLARVPDPDTRQEIHDEVRAAKGSRATQTDYDEAIAKRRSPRHAPDPEVGDTYVDDINQDPGDDFPVDANPDADAPLTDRGGDEEAELSAPSLPASGDAGADASPPAAVAPEDDNPGDLGFDGSLDEQGYDDSGSEINAAMFREQTADEESGYDGPPLPESKPRVNNHTSISAGAGKKTSVPSARVFSDRGLDAGDVSRTLLDMSGWMEALTENATATQKAALRQALGGTTQPAPAMTAPVTLKDIKSLIREHLTADEIKSLEWDLPQIRKEIGARERQAVTVS